MDDLTDDDLAALDMESTFLHGKIIRGGENSRHAGHLDQSV